MNDQEPTKIRITRQRSIEHSAEFLGKRIVRLRRIERRFAWFRLTAFGLGCAATWWAAASLETGPGWLVFLTALTVFGGVAGLHRRLDSAIYRFNIWREMRLAQLARMKLDWEHIPAAPVLPGERSPLDIDLDLTGPRSLHYLIDLAISQEGSQLLADWLTQTDPNPELVRTRQQVVRELTPLFRFRDRMLLDLRLVSKQQLQGASLLKWLNTPIPAERLGWLLLISAILIILNGGLFWLNMLGKLPAYWIFSLAAYMVFYFANSGILASFLTDILELDRELEKFHRILHHLETYPLGRQPNLERLCTVFRRPNQLPSVELRQVRWVTSLVGLRMNMVLGLLINLVLPWDFTCALLASRLRQRAAQYLPTWLDTWYQLEALISLANLSYLNPDYVFPEVSPDSEPVLQARALGHPLISSGQKVCNDFIFSGLGQVVVITGSNMAGKSTFIKTIGVNLCLAYAGGPVNAAELRFQPFRLHTCMRITDSLSDGYSYFYAEVKCLKRMLQSLRTQNRYPLLYLVDEIYRGTNNRERLAGSRALVQALAGAPGVGMIATHDLELAGLADTHPQVINYHFRDQVRGDRLIFDYRLHSGPCPTTNALRIMAMEGLPTEEND